MPILRVRDVEKGTLLKLKPDAKKLYVRGYYDREFKKYRIDDWDDISRDRLVDGSRLVYV
jgi:hypothetical protein